MNKLFCEERIFPLISASAVDMVLLEPLQHQQLGGGGNMAVTLFNCDFACVCVFVVLVKVRIFCLLCFVFCSEHSMYCFMKVRNLSVPVVIMVSPSIAYYLALWVYPQIHFLKFLMRNQSVKWGHFHHSLCSLQYISSLIFYL